VIFGLQKRASGGARHDRKVGLLHRCAHLATDRTSMVALIDGLEKLGLVVREVHPDERRRYSLALTPKGRQFPKKATGIVNQVQERFLAALSAGDWQGLKKYLTTLIVKQRE
jgi:DNA-binding MarR family transcriptional regulator